MNQFGTRTDPIGGQLTREVKILMRLPDGRNGATRQAVHGSAPCLRIDVTALRLGTEVDYPRLDSSRDGRGRRTP